MFECLDIAGVSTLSTIWGDAYLNPSKEPDAAASALLTSGQLILQDHNEVLNLDNATNLYGLFERCDGKIVGDGVVNGLDLYVLGASYFDMGPYADTGPIGARVTTQGRPETHKRCNTHGYGENYTRLEWQSRIAWNTCFSPVDEKLYLRNVTRRRRMQELEPTRRSLTGGEASKALTVVDGYVAPDSDSTVQDLNARPLLWSSASPLGNWYLIHIPRIVVALEMFVRGTELAESTPLSNVAAPAFNSSEVPEEPDKFALRFIRHRERSGVDSDTCAVVGSTNNDYESMRAGTIGVGQRSFQSLDRTELCAFDLMLWVPVAAAVDRSDDCLIEVAQGSVAMDGGTGVHQERNECASMFVRNPLQSPPYPLPPPAPPAPPLTPSTTDGSVIGVVIAAMGLVLSGFLLCVTSGGVNVHAKPDACLDEPPRHKKSEHRKWQEACDRRKRLSTPPPLLFGPGKNRSPRTVQN